MVGKNPSYTKDVKYVSHPHTISSVLPEIVCVHSSISINILYLLFLLHYCYHNIYIVLYFVPFSLKNSVVWYFRMRTDRSAFFFIIIHFIALPVKDTSAAASFLLDFSIPCLSVNL